MSENYGHTLMLFAGNLWGRPSLLAIRGEGAKEAGAQGGWDLDDGLSFPEANDEPQERLGLFVWEGEIEFPDEFGYEWTDSPGWRDATKADLELFGFPIPSN